MRLPYNPSFEALLALGPLIDVAARRMPHPMTAAPLNQYLGSHKDFASAQQDVLRIQSALEGQRRRIQRHTLALATLIRALPLPLELEGLPRQQVLKPLGFPAPSVIAQQRPAQMVKTVTALAEVLLARPNLSSSGATVAKALGEKSSALAEALAPRSVLEAEYERALSKRNIIRRECMGHLRSLHKMAEAAEVQGAHGLVETLFGEVSRYAAPKRTRARSKPLAPERPAPG